ncbi:PREDICTED: actin-85C-like [Aptenodytes forsteri]|uniref:actin-85C-like n=1 Tax=Aptenodytes forsteri TaxID=9233 RepID=UPI0004F4719D|nr:PREDICTED: actin-85C-like [Aptenodytes forsteri]
MGAKPAERYKTLCAAIDMGTGHTRSGLAGDEQPRSVVPSQAGGGPILTHGVVTDWYGLEELWHRVLYQKLDVCLEEVAVLATDTLLSPAANREKVAKLLFKGFGVSAMLVLPRSLLAAYSFGPTTRVWGIGTSYAAGVREGYALPHAIFRLDVAGDALTFYLGWLLGSHGVHLGADPLHCLKKTCCCLLPGAGGALPLTLPALAAGPRALPARHGKAGMSQHGVLGALATGDGCLQCRASIPSWGPARAHPRGLGGPGSPFSF